VDNFVSDMVVSHPLLCTFLAVYQFNMLHSYSTDFNPEDEDYCVPVKLWLLTNQATHNHSPEDNDLIVFLLRVACASVD